MIADVFVNVLATLSVLWLGWVIYDAGYENGKTVGRKEARRELNGKSGE